MKTLFIILILALTSFTFAQTKYYIPSEDGYYRVEFIDDIKSNIEDYKGLYEDIYPGFFETGEYAGDAMYAGITLYFENGVLSIKSYTIVEGMENEAVNEYVLNPEIKGNNITFTYPGEENSKFDGKFVIGKYKNKSKQIKTVFGILSKSYEYGTDKAYYSFYVKKN